mgnify:CR=1 FL=1
MNGSLPPSRKFKAEDMAEAMLRSGVRTGTTATKTARYCGVVVGTSVLATWAWLTATPTVQVDRYSDIRFGCVSRLD